MIIKIALGILLGVVLLIVCGVILVVVSAALSRLQEEEVKRPKHKRIRPEASNYERLQEIKQRAKEEHPEHWKEEK